MVEIPTPLEKDFGWLSYVWIYCSYVEHREESHPMCGMLGIVHAHDMHDHLVDDLGLAIHLGVGGSGFGELGVQ
jgi:hypothetical protein